MDSKNYECCIIGAGPAGLGAALELVKNNIKNILIIDKHSVVGGLSRTELFDNYRFDVGPHRFFSKNKEINTLWHEVLGSEFLPVDRLTRIFYKGRYFNYPLKPFNALTQLGLFESAHAMLSYLYAFVNTRNNQALTFEDWITQKFGRKLYETFFKTYTEKVWGIPCNQIGAEWAAQRIKGLDVREILKNLVFKNNNTRAKTLVEEFRYPRLGAGQMYERMAETVAVDGCELLLNTSVTRIDRKDHQINSIEVKNNIGEKYKISAKHFFNSAPLTHFIHLLSPSPDEKIIKANQQLYYRDHITVDLIVDGNNFFPDQWIYVHSADVKMARLANYNNFSMAMVNFENKSALSVEYFIFQSDPLWKMSDADLIELAKEELHFMGLIPKEKVLKGWVVRETESYPTYYLGYKDSYDILKNEIDTFENLTPIGRGGLYKYNNQDHSTMSGILAARKYVSGSKSNHEIWTLNIDAEYLESGKLRTSK